MVTLEIDGMTNPNTIEETDSFSVTTLTPEDDRIDFADTGFTVRVSNPAEMSVNSLELTSREVGERTAIEVALTLPTVPEADGYLTVTLPPTVSISQASLRCKCWVGFATGQGSGDGECSLSGDVIRIDTDVS